MKPPANRIALVVSDVDGTLVTKDKRLTPEVLAAAALLRSRGIPLALVSSRPPRGLSSVAAALSIDVPCAGFNGGGQRDRRHQVAGAFRDDLERGQRVRGGDRALRPAASRSRSMTAAAAATAKTLAIDIGGTGLKASVLDTKGRMLADKVRVPTPYPCPPKVMMDALAALVAPLPAWDRISVGFPGVVRGGRVLTAPHFGNDVWRDYPLAESVGGRLGKPVRLLNDAEIQGLAVVDGKGIELVLVLGTGVGTALFRDGELMPHLELAQHPIGKGRKTYNEYIGDAALHRKGRKEWNRRVRKTARILVSLLHYDVLHLSGGNGPKVDVDLPGRVKLAANTAGIVGGVKLWEM